MRYLCFDVGGTDTKYAVITEDYRIISKASFPTEINRGGADLLKRMIEIIRRAEVEGGLAGVAVSSPGIVDCDTGAVVFANERGKGFQGISYRQTIGKRPGSTAGRKMTPTASLGQKPLITTAIFWS